MIKRIIEISREPAHLSVRLDQLVVQPIDKDRAEAKTIPCEDIGFVLIDHPQVTITLPALATLADYGAVVVVCGKNHLPSGLLLPMSEHTEVVWRFADQIDAGKPLVKKLWQQVIVAKIRAQAGNLEAGSPTRRLLEEMARQVRSDDAGNSEAQAAKVYWSAWLVPGSTPPLASSVTAEQGIPCDQDFRRDPDALDPLNALLNYGYAVLRAAVARAIVSAGLFPAMGIHHCHRANHFALADDLMEPMRPMVDAVVRQLHRTGRHTEGLTQLNKAALLGVLNQTVALNGETGPLMVALHRYVAGFVRCLRREAGDLAIPVPAG
ncbi:MAG: type II CRISPR-associated endonuclease Cas1 [Phycisphaeraceae bacterium]|nr:type II CRISPR-associated endonuclease Cas1 [Phycisphaeraceae bacterium]